MTETTRKIFSNYVNSFQDDRTMSSFARVTVKNAGGNAIVDPVGLPVISDSLGAFVPYANGADITAVTASTLPDESPVAVIVGPAHGAGMNTHDVTITAAGTEVTVMYRDAVIKGDNIDWAWLDTAGVAATGVTAADATEQADFITQLEVQRVKNLTSAEVVDPSYV